MSSSPSNFPAGLSTADKGANLGSLPYPDPTRVYQFFDDFSSFKINQTVTITDPGNATIYGSWLQTVGAGSGTAALISGNNGLITLTPSGTDNDNVFLQWQGGASAATETVRFASGKKAWFKTKFKLANATQADAIIGLAITDTSPLDASDGVFFLKADDAATAVLKVVKNSTASSSSTITLADDTYITLGFHYDGKQTFKVFANDILVSTVPYTNMPDDEDLTVTIGTQNGSAGAKVMTVDYVFFAQER